MNVKPGRRSPAGPAPARDRRRRLASVGRLVSGALAGAGRGVAIVLARAPGTIRATRAGVHGTTSALQVLPDPTLRWLAASSVGLAAGSYFAGAPRLVAAAGLVPAMLLGAAIVLRSPSPDPPQSGR